MSDVPAGDSEEPTAQQRADSRPTFREEADRIVLANPSFSLAFSTRNGNIVSLVQRQTQTELITDGEAAADGFLWRLELAGDGGKPASLSNVDCAEFTHSVGYHRHHGSLRLWLQWSGLRVGGSPIEGRVTAHITFPPTAPAALVEAEIQLPEHLSVRSFSFPAVCALGCGDALSEEALFFPHAGGALLSDPRGARPGPEASWEATYPWPASVQFFGYSCAGRTSAWVAAADPEGAVKTMVAGHMPRSNRLILRMVHHPTPRSDGLWSTDYATALGVVFGDWFEAAREYRSWAREQSWCARGRGGERRLPSLTSSYGLWASSWAGPRAAAGCARQLQRLVNVPIKLDWRCWHGCAREGAYPDYFPPRDGEEAFSLARGQLAESGVLAQLSLNGLLASPDSESWQAERAEAYSLLTAAEGPAAHTPPSRRSPLLPMCPATRYWREKLAALARQALQHGADGIYLEDLTASSPLLCGNSDHGHASGAAQWTAGVRAALAAVRRALGEGTHLAADGPSEICVDLADAFFSRHPAAERDALLPDPVGRRWEPIPLFASVYHDYTTLLGPPVSLANHHPHDPLWPQAVISDLRSPASIMGRDYQSQFCLHVGRAISWGYHPVLANFSPDQTRTEASNRKLAFLTAALRAQAWGVGALLPYAEFMGPLAIEADAADLELLVNPPGSASADRRSVRRRLIPVLGSAWRTPGSGLALLVANIHQSAREFTARLRTSRLTPQLPLRPIGRTFSEDGDVPAASLRTSGSEISGRLPGRSFLLLSLR